MDLHRLILLAPGFGITHRWPIFLGQADALDQWRKNGKWSFMHSASGKESNLSFDFVQDLQNHKIAMDLPQDIRLQKPALIFHGVDDQTVPFDNSAVVKANNSGVELIRLDDNHDLVNSLPKIWSICQKHL